MNDKFGSYINKLMVTVLDSEEDIFVKDLAISELNRIIADMSDFVRNNSKSEDEERKKTEKILLQEKKDAENKEKNS